MIYVFYDNTFLLHLASIILKVMRIHFFLHFYSSYIVNKNVQETH